MLCCSGSSCIAMKQDTPPAFTELTAVSRRRGTLHNVVPLPPASASHSSGNYYSNERKRQLSRRKAERCSQAAHLEPHIPRSSIPDGGSSEEVLVAPLPPAVNPPRHPLASDASAHSVRTVAHKPIRRPRPCWNDGLLSGRGTDIAGRANAGAFPIFAIDAPSASYGDGGCAANSSAV